MDDISLAERVENLTRSVAEIRENQIRYEERFNSLVKKLDTQATLLTALTQSLDDHMKQFSELKYQPAMATHKKVADTIRLIIAAAIGALMSWGSDWIRSLIK